MRKKGWNFGKRIQKVENIEMCMRKSPFKD